MIKPFAALALATVGLVGSAPAWSEEFGAGNTAQGQLFALEVCTPCHVVAHGQRSPARFAIAPSFAEIANTKAMTAAALAAFLNSPHPTMPNLILSPGEQSAVIAYITSLRSR